MNEKQYAFNYTVIIPVQLCPNNIEMCLESVIGQEYSFRYVQVLVVNNERDKTVREKLNRYLVTYPNIEYITTKQDSWGRIINFVVENKLAKGRLVTILEPWDQLNKKCFKTIDEQLVENSDLVITSFHGVIQKDDAKKSFAIRNKKKVEFFFRGKVLKTKKQIEQARTPWAVSLGKFYKNQLFYLLPRSLEKINYQDANFFNLALNMAHQVQYIDQSLGFWLESPNRTFQKRPWTKKECEDWLISIYNLVSSEAKLIALMYITQFKSFREYLIESHIRIQISGRINMSWLPFGTRTFMKMYYLMKAGRFIVR